MSLVTPGESHFWPQGHYLNELGKGPLGDATYKFKYQGSKAYGFRQEDFFMFFLIYAFVKHVTPRLGPSLAQVT